MELHPPLSAGSIALRLCPHDELALVDAHQHAGDPGPTDAGRDQIVGATAVVDRLRR